MLNVSDALLRPRLILYAYATSNGVQDSEDFSVALGIQGFCQTAAEAWELYLKTPPYAPLNTLTNVYSLSEFIAFAVNFSLAAELDESICAVAKALGGGVTPVFAARLFAASREEAAVLRAQWIFNNNTVELLFEASETLKLNASVLRFLLGAQEETLPMHLDKMASRVGAVFSWHDLVLPDTQKALLRHICARVRFDSAVYDNWGYGKVTPYGRGVRALFSGPPGTGKTMAAQVVAGELGMELFRVDISATVSKYIGETEKNLDEIFREAGKSGGILFFDEADAIFGKRSEQKDSHDKYANMQTNFLLQRVEDYCGVILLATNFATNLDAAFMRRIQVRVDFPAPDKTARLVIWRSLLKPPARIDEEIDFEFLAKSFRLTGSEIKNIVLSAAFIAAEQDAGITMRGIIKALEMEYAKTDRILTAKEIEEF